MNILVFSWRGPKHPLAGGAEQVMHEHMKGWKKAGHEVTLFTSTFEGGLSEEIIDGIKLIRSGNQILGVQLKAFFWYWKNRNYDLIVDQFHGIPFFTPLYTKQKKLAVLQEVAHEVWLKNDLPWPLNIIIGLIGYTFEPLIFLFYKNVKFMVGSESAKIDLSKVGIDGKNVKVIPHGVIVKKPKSIAKAKIPTVTFLGALARDKGIEEAIKTFGLLSSINKIQFWIIGKGGEEYVKYLKSLCKKVGILRKTKFWGFVNDTQKFNLLFKSHLLVNPSFKEGWGLVNIEANAVGTPVVAYRNPGLIDSVKDGVSGIIVNTNPKSMARKVEELLSNNSRLQKLSRSSISWSKNFTWEKSKRISLKFIESL